MALYRKKTLTEASRYVSGMEDGWALLWSSGKIFEMLRTRDAAQAEFDGMFRNADEPHTGEPEPAIVPVIHTKEGLHAITEGDWIATGPQGERYPIKAAIFEATYELVETGPGPNPSADLTTHQIAARVSSLRLKLDDLIRLSRQFGSPESNSIAEEWKVFDEIGTKAQWLASFGEVQQRPVGLRMIRGKRS